MTARSSSTSTGVRVLQALGTLIVIGVAGLATWIQLERRRDAASPAVPPPDERELPPVPPEGENGWLLVAGDEVDFGEVPTADLAWPREDADRMASALLDWRPGPDAEALVRVAFALPRFAPACAIDMLADCPAIPVLRAQRAATALALRDALEPPEGPPIDLAHVLSLAEDARAGPRDLVTAMLGFVLVRETLNRIADLLVLAESGAAALAPDQLAALSRVLTAIDPDAMTLERGVMVEWMQMDGVLADMEAENGGRGADYPYLRAVMGSYYAALRARARDDSLPDPPLPALAWWRRWLDPVTWVFVEAVPAPLGPRIDDCAQTRREIADLLPSLRGRVQALGAPN